MGDTVRAEFDELVLHYLVSEQVAERVVLPVKRICGAVLVFAFDFQFDLFPFVDIIGVWLGFGLLFHNFVDGDFFR